MSNQYKNPEPLAEIMTMSDIDYVVQLQPACEWKLLNMGLFSKECAKLLKKCHQRSALATSTGTISDRPILVFLQKKSISLVGEFG